MYLGRIVELAPTRELFANPQHPYTRMLLDAVPDLEMTGKSRVAVAGEVPNPLDPPPGCTFHPRCPFANERCRREIPQLRAAGGGARARWPATRSRKDGCRRARFQRRHSAIIRGDLPSTSPPVGRFEELLPGPRFAPHPDQARRFQVVRRSDDHRHAGPARRHRRPQRLRQVERHRRRALGARRIQGVGAARRVDAGRHLQRRRRPQAGRPRVGRASFRQQPRPHRRPVGPVRRDLDQARADARRRLDVLHQQHPGPPPRHPRPLPRHRPRAARLRDHRAGHDLARHRGEARGASRVPRGSRRRVEVQGAAQGDRGTAFRHARESLARRGHPPRARQPARRASSSRRRSPRNIASTRRASRSRSTCSGTRSSRTPCARATAARPRSHR